MFDFSKLLLIALGGSLGAVCRYLISELMLRLGEGFSWGTLAANLIGCFVMGILVGIGLTSSHRAYVLFGIGFLGSLTTFSTFSVESLKHASEGRIDLFGINILVNVVLCLLVAWAGIALAKSWEIGSTSE